jgi:hypothetical protein
VDRTSAATASLDGTVQHLVTGIIDATHCDAEDWRNTTELMRQGQSRLLPFYFPSASTIRRLICSDFGGLNQGDHTPVGLDNDVRSPRTIREFVQKVLLFTHLVRVVFRDSLHRTCGDIYAVMLTHFPHRVRKRVVGAEVGKAAL